MIRRLWWHILARYYRARAARSQQDACRFEREAEKFFRMLEAAE